MRTRALLFLSTLALILGATACEGDDADAPVTGYGPADAEVLALTSSDAPGGMSLRNGISGVRSIYQLASTEQGIEALQESGAAIGFEQIFTVDDRGEEAPEPAGRMDATLASSKVILFADENGAADALTFLRSDPERLLDDARVRDAQGLGAGAFLRTARQGSMRMLTLYWREDNIVLGVHAESPSGDPDPKGLRAFAEKARKRVAQAEPSSGELDIPPPAEAGEALLTEDFEEPGGWDRGAADGLGPPARYVDGGLQLAIDGPGSRWLDTAGRDGEDPTDFDNAVIEVAAEHVQGGSARWGLMCRIVEGAGFYLFVLGTDGFAGIYSAVAPTEPLEEMASLRRSSVVGGAVRAQHRVRADCSGDGIMRLGLMVDGQVVLEAYDDDPLAPGAAGMWIESHRSPASVLFDDLMIFEAIRD